MTESIETESFEGIGAVSDPTTNERWESVEYELRIAGAHSHVAVCLDPDLMGHYSGSRETLVLHLLEGHTIKFHVDKEGWPVVAGSLQRAENTGA